MITWRKGLEIIYLSLYRTVTSQVRVPPLYMGENLGTHGVWGRMAVGRMREFRVL